MKLVKSLLLGSAAGLAAVAGAQAADLPVRKAAPAVTVDYVRVCSIYGTGYFVVPGTDGCLKIGGRARADFMIAETFGRTQDRIGFRALGNIELEHRQATEYGLLRAVVRYSAEIASGPFNGGFETGSPVGTDAFLDVGYVQFGGSTYVIAGRTPTFFANQDISTQIMGSVRTIGSGGETQLFGVESAFGGGFSAGVAVEDPRGRFRSTAPTTSAVGGVLVLEDGFTAAPTRITYLGNEWPDLVGHLKWVQSWGNFQLSGALHQIRTAGVLVDDDADGFFEEARGGDDEWGWAVGASGQIGLTNYFGPGGAFWFFGTYSNGAPGYAGFGSNVGLGPSSTSNFGFSGSATAAGGLPVADAVYGFDADDDFGRGGLHKTTAWSLAAGIRVGWSSTLRSNFFGSIAEVDFGGNSSARVAAGPFEGAQVGYVDFTETRLGANLIWSPVSRLDIGVEVLYTKVDPRGSFLASVPVGYSDTGTLRVEPRLVGSEDHLSGRFRIQRDF